MARVSPLFLALSLTLLAPPALALCQRADGTYTNDCRERDRKVEGGRVSRADAPVPTPEPAEPEPAAPALSGPLKIEILPQNETDPRTHWRDRRQAMLERLEDDEMELRYYEDKLSYCRREVARRAPRRCDGLEEEVDSHRERLAEARQEVEEQLFDECRRHPHCEPGYLR